MGKTKPTYAALRANEILGSPSDWVTFGLFDGVLVGIVVIFFVGDVLMTGRLISIGLLAIYDRIRSHVTERRASAAYKPQVAV